MDKTLFTKYSTERNEEFKISTTIKQKSNAEKYVVKKAESNKSKNHIKKIHDYYLSLKKIYSNNEKVEIVPCKLENQDTEAVFPYIEGVSYSEILNTAYKESFQKYLEKMETFYFLITNVTSIIPFSDSKEINDIFGDILPLLGEPCPEISNIDIHFNNVILRDNIYRIFDYEWTFNLPLPFSYILYRTLSVDLLFSSLNCDEKSEVYKILKINQNNISIYTQMEENFHKYLGGKTKTLQNVYNDLNNVIFNIKNLDINNYIIKSKVEKISNDKIIDTNIILQNPLEKTLEFNIKDNVDTIKYFPFINGNGNIRIENIIGKNLDGNNIDLEIFSNNAEYSSNGFFFFENENGYIEIKTSNIQTIFINFNILNHNNNLISDVISLKNTQDSLTIEINNLRKKLLDLGDQHNTLNDKYNTLNDKYNTLNNKYNTLNNEFVFTKKRLDIIIDKPHMAIFYVLNWKKDKK